MVDDRRSDAELIRASLDDPEVFGGLYSRHGEAVFCFVARRVRRQDAADLTGEVFARAFQLRVQFDLTRASVRPWLYGIARNVVRNHLRRMKVRGGRDPEGGMRMLAAGGGDPYGQIDVDLDATSASLEIRAAILALKQSDRDALLLYAVEGLTYKETAEVMGVPTGTIRSRGRV